MSAIDVTSRFAVPVLHTFNVAVLVAPTHVSTKLTFPGTVITGTSPTITPAKKMSGRLSRSGEIVAGARREGQAPKSRPAAHALPL